MNLSLVGFEFGGRRQNSRMDYFVSIIDQKRV